MGSMRNGSFSARKKLELRTDEPASSSWPTAVVTDLASACNATASRDGSKGGKRKGNPGTTLTDAMRMWQTPTASHAGTRQQPRGGARGELLLSGQAKQWPTPATRDYKGANGPDHLTNGTGRKHLDQLPNFVAHCSHQGRTTGTDGSAGSTPAVLNPLFVETLMGLPIGWTGYGLSATAWSRYRQQLRSEYSRIVHSQETRDD